MINHIFPPVFILSLFISYLPSPNVGITPPGLTTQMLIGQMSVGEHILWTWTLDKFTRADLSESVVNKIQGHPRDNTGQNTKDTPSPRIGIKIPDPAGNWPGPPGWKAGILSTTPRRRTSFYWDVKLYCTNLSTTTPLQFDWYWQCLNIKPCKFSLYCLLDKTESTNVLVHKAIVLFSVGLQQRAYLSSHIFTPI